MKKEYYLLIFLFICLLFQMYRIVIYEQFSCNMAKDSCYTVQTNIWGQKNNIFISKYSELGSIVSTKSHNRYNMEYAQLQGVNKYGTRKLISSKKYYDFQNCNDIINYLNTRISKREDFNYKFYGISNKYNKLY